MGITKSEVTTAVDTIERAVYGKLKTFGFKKHGRSLFRFVSSEEDICQIITFQPGQAYRNETHLLTVNVAIRVPECVERNFSAPIEKKKYYYDYDASIRSQLGWIDGNGKNKVFDVKNQDLDHIIKEILEDIEEKVLPVFHVLSSREAILEHRRDYPNFDYVGSHQILLDEAMIYGHLENMEKAKECFELYYQKVVASYEHNIKYGRKEKISPGAVLSYCGKTYTNDDADEDGYVTVYGASHGHIDYLDELAVKNGLR